MNNIIGIDIGYSYAKISYQDKVVKLPTAVCFATDIGNKYGDDNIYDFEGEKYYVGNDAVTGESFSTTDFKFLLKFAPLIVYHILKKFENHNMTTPVEIRTGLAISDWENKKEFHDRLVSITVNGNTINTNPIIIPQGAGCVIDWVNSINNGEYPDRISVIDLGYRTINFISYLDGKPVKKDISGYPGHGVSSIIKPFTSFLENTYALSFSEQEAIKIFLKGEFKYNGIMQEKVAEKIVELKSQFVKKLFHSVLVNDKKTMAISDVVLIAGGGAYLLEGTTFPPNVKFSNKPYEFSNVRGFVRV